MCYRHMVPFSNCKIWTPYHAMVSINDVATILGIIFVVWFVGLIRTLNKHCVCVCVCGIVAK